MNPLPESTAKPPALPVGRLLLIAIALLTFFATGCAQLRLPAIDPTGSCLFSPLPTTTTLALPGSAGESCGCLNCLRGLNCFRRLCPSRGLGFGGPTFQFPSPVFVEPATPPPCATPQSSAAGTCNEPCVPSAPCAGSCKNGPPAVLLGDECNMRDFCHLPERGKRGCIVMSPMKIVAPVGGEVVLLSGICGTDGYLQMNEKLEWMLSQDSVGNFIQVGDDDPGKLHRLAGSKIRPEKRDPSYAIGRTSMKRTLITRGNLDPRDDVQLEKGQTWLTISSPSEGTSRVTVLAPDSECWDQRKATATIYWVDARWQFPSPQILPAGQPAEMTTRVTRSEGSLPARGWKVRYEIQQPEMATFAGTNGASVVEAEVNDDGNATVQLLPRAGAAGTTAVTMEVIRPGGESDNIPSLTLGSGQTFVTWSAPQLAIRASGPEVATFDTPVQIEAIISNPGNQPATNVKVELRLPPGTRVESADSFARVVQTPGGGSVSWDIGTIPPQMELPVYVNLASQSPVDLTFQVRGDGLVAEDTVRVDVFRPALTLKVQPLKERVETGQEVRFNVDITNTGDRPLANPYVRITGDDGMIHEDGAKSVDRKKDDEVLQPGETWAKEVTFIPTQSGRRCITVDAFADGGQRATQPACITVINPIPETPALSAKLESRDRLATGQQVLVRGYIVNDGQGTAKNVKVSMVFDPQLQVVEATNGADLSRVTQNVISWMIPEIKPGQQEIVEANFNAIRPNPRTRVAMTAQSSEGSLANTDTYINIVDGTPPSAPLAPPQLPPARPTPEVPAGQAPEPLRGTPPRSAPPSVPGSQLSQRLLARLTSNANVYRVNDPIPYTLSLINDSSRPDANVDIRFILPPGVKLERVNEVTNPERSEFNVNAGQISLAPIPLLKPGERVNYTLLLRSNRPQTFDLDVDIRSDSVPQGFQESMTTTVVP